MRFKTNQDLSQFKNLFKSPPKYKNKIIMFMSNQKSETLLLISHQVALDNIKAFLLGYFFWFPTIILGFYLLQIHIELLTLSVWGLGFVPNNVTVGEDRDTDGTEVNRTDGFGAPVSAILSTWEYIISFILYMFKVF